MKTTIFKISMIFLLLSLMGAGCQKDEQPQETYPAKIILGRWELSKVLAGGNVGYRTIDKDDPNEVIYLEFSSDSLSKNQYFVEGNLRTETSKYWLVDTLLYYDNRISPWIFDFTDYNTLHLGNAFPALRPIGRIFKRIKQ